MSEYIDIETEINDEDHTISFFTNLKLSEEGTESYDSNEAMEEGSPMAQALSVIEGILFLQIDRNDLMIIRDPQVGWHSLVADVSAVLKDFFL